LIDHDLSFIFYTNFLCLESKATTTNCFSKEKIVFGYFFGT